MIDLELQIPGSDYHTVGQLIVSLAPADDEGELSEQAYHHAHMLLQSQWKKVETVAAALLEYEIVDADGCRRVLVEAER